MRMLPVLRSGRTLDLPVQIWRDPATIKVARLRDDAQITDTNFIQQGGIKRNMSRNCGKRRSGGVIGPGGAGGGRRSRHHVEIPGNPLPFAKAAALRRVQGGVNILQWQVIGRRVVGLQHPQCARRVRDKRAAKLSAEGLTVNGAAFSAPEK